MHNSNPPPPPPAHTILATIRPKNLTHYPLLAPHHRPTPRVSSASAAQLVHAGDVDLGHFSRKALESGL